MDYEWFHRIRSLHVTLIVICRSGRGCLVDRIDKASLENAS